MGPSGGERGEARAGQQPAARSAVQILQFECRARGTEYFRLWIRGLVLSLLTLGIYSAWAKVHGLQYFYGSTRLAGTAFEYHGQPLQILRGRLLTLGAAALQLLFLLLAARFAPPLLGALALLPALALPFLIVRTRRFQLRMSSWRAVRFGFHGTYAGALLACVGGRLITASSLGLLWPLSLYGRARYLLEHTSFDGERFRSGAPLHRYAAVCAATAALAPVLALPAALALLAFSERSRALHAALGSGAPLPVADLCGLALGVLLGLLALIATRACYRCSRLNAERDGLALGADRLRCQMAPEELFAIEAVNLLCTLLSFGLFHPWAAVRRHRYELESMWVESTGTLERLVAEERKHAADRGEELDDVLGLELDP